MERKVGEEIERIKEQVEEKIQGVWLKIFALYHIPVSTSPVPVTASPVSVKLSTYDGKTNWEVYKTQFSIISEANGWIEGVKVCQLAASFRGEAAEVPQTLPDTERLNLNSLYNSLVLRFGQKFFKDCARLQMKTSLQKTEESLQENASEVERLAILAFSDHPATVREVISLQYFVDGLKPVAEGCPIKRTRGRLQLYNGGAPFERITFDILGPIPRSSDGNNNILVVMDYFTKWPEAYLISDQEASTVVEILVQHWISRFGVPLQLHSDQGRNFDSAVSSLSWYPVINRTETRNCHFSCLPIGVPFTRPPAIPSYQMLFGRDLRLPADLLFSWPPDAPLAPKEYVEKLQARMEKMHHVARKRIGIAFEKMKTPYDARATGHDFHEGDKVWLWNSKRSKRLSPKLKTNWEDPYAVLKD
ncbi:retrovirus-related Pol polyprotein from transposon 412 [Trichonephila clavipes]|nr:retrovirus-related Pol polyprotein from transposon 412 [Trichonephila clavipes]